MRIVFAGTPEFAVPPLKAIIAEGHSVVGVYTQPDRPQGRGRKIIPTPVKALALAEGLPVFQPESFKEEESIDVLRNLKPDLMVVVAYGLILPKSVIDIAPMGCINIHASLLPRWRGAAPIQRSILEGDAETGVTIMYIEPRLDAGPMILKRNVAIQQNETASELHDRLSVLGAEAVIEAIALLSSGKASPKTQEEAQVTYASKITKEEALLDFNRPAEALARKVRAFNAWPVAETRYQGTVMRIWRAEAMAHALPAPPGTLLALEGRLLIATPEGSLNVLELQLPGGKRISSKDFLNAKPTLPIQLEGF